MLTRYTQEVQRLDTYLVKYMLITFYEIANWPELICVVSRGINISQKNTVGIVPLSSYHF